MMLLENSTSLHASAAAQYSLSVEDSAVCDCPRLSQPQGSPQIKTKHPEVLGASQLESEEIRGVSRAAQR